MPQRFLLNDEYSIRTYLTDIYDLMDKIDFSQNGIIHKNIIDWLLED